MTPERQEQISEIVAAWEEKNPRNDFSDLTTCLAFENGDEEEDGLDERGREANHEEALQFASKIGIPLEELFEWNRLEIRDAVSSLCHAVERERRRRQKRKQRAGRWDSK